MPRVLIATFDGLLPAEVTPDIAPGIHSLGERGVRFSSHHAVFPTVTRCNGASMSTGRYPGAHGIAGNLVVIDEYDPHQPMEVLEPQLSALAEATDGSVLLSSTLGELIAPHGMSHVSVVGGSSGNAYTHHANAQRAGAGGVIHIEFSLPRHLHAQVEERCGPWPDDARPGLGRVRHVADVAIDFVIPELDPDVLWVWFPEPDGSNHKFGVGSPASRQGLAEADRQLTRIIDAIRSRGEEPDVLVISDHGYSTIDRAINVEAAVRDAGWPGLEEEGGVVAAHNGGSVLFYVNGGDEAVDRLAAWLTDQPWAGAMVAGNIDSQVEGLLPGTRVGVSGERAPDIAMSLRWSPADGAPNSLGYSHVTGGQPGQGTHGSGSPQEMRNTLIAAGPHLRSGVVSDVPTGNVDLTPTVLRLLGLELTTQFDGRCIEEALVDGPDPKDVVRHTEELSMKRAAGSGVFEQSAVLQQVGTATYVTSLYGGLRPT